MSYNSFGHVLRISTFGESHGPAIGCVIDGCPPGLEITAEEIRARSVCAGLPEKAGIPRNAGKKRTCRSCPGVFEGRTTGTPIALLIENTDARSKDYDNIKRQFRPGHADYTYWKKYGFRDYRGGGRSSARETTMRVAAGAVARKWLKQEPDSGDPGLAGPTGPDPVRCAMRMGDRRRQSLFLPGPGTVPELESYMDELQEIRRFGRRPGQRGRTQCTRRAGCAAFTASSTQIWPAR